MRKLIYTCAMLTVMAFGLTGCGGDEKTKSTSEEPKATSADQQTEDTQEEVVNVEATTVADDLLAEGDFKDNLATVDTTMALTRLYSLDPEQIEDSMFYTNSQATAEEIAVIKVKSEDYVETVQAAYEARIEDQKTACESYLPDEMPKLEAAVVYTSGNYVVLCVSNDSDKALEIIKSHF